MFHKFLHFAYKVLSEVAQAIEQIKNRRAKSNLAATASILAGLVLDQEMIKTFLKEEIVKESVVYQQIVREATAKGAQQGAKQQRQEIALNMLASGFSSQQIRELTGLSVRELSQLKKSAEKSTKSK